MKDQVEKDLIHAQAAKIDLENEENDHETDQSQDQVQPDLLIVDEANINHIGK